ncbi:cupin domain-containing protein [Halorarum salinum]|uniref:Cupin domain-containing protein n=1 Tax=Halorarum salinum TaxID=2743089 RepID=A0A7D5Q7M4_9EURY|nr:cupin domain-containing protein [Halobaculum salinum]QLG60297.1 cupin domain-containing protein [Halobaculum salinum]
MGEPFVIEPEERKPLDTPYHDNMTARELVNPEFGSDNIVFRITEIEPGKRAVDDWHAHDTSEQLFYILSGEGTLRMSETGREEDEEIYDLVPDVFAFIPPGTYHNAWSTGDTPLRMIVIWTPPYESFEDWNVDSDNESDESESQ